VPLGTTVTFTASPPAGSMFAGWRGAADGVALLRLGRLAGHLHF